VGNHVTTQLTEITLAMVTVAPKRQQVGEGRTNVTSHLSKTEAGTRMMEATRRTQPVGRRRDEREKEEKALLEVSYVFPLTSPSIKL